MKKTLSVPLFAILIIFTVNSMAFAASDPFPAFEDRPVVADFLPSPGDTWHCDPNGSNSTGEGTSGNPWRNLLGGQGTVGPGDLVYLHGGAYPYESGANWAYSPNQITTDGTEANPIVITNYPGEIATFTTSALTSPLETWSMTLDGNYQKLIGTMVGSSYGIQFTGGITIRGSYCQVSNVEFIRGANNGGDLNPSMITVCPVVGDTPYYTVLTNNMFRDGVNLPTNGSSPRGAGIRMFWNYYTEVAYNIFQNNTETSIGGALYCKDRTVGGNFHHNKFYNNDRDFTYVGQAGSEPWNSHSDFNFHHNLLVDSTTNMYYYKAAGANIDIYQNTFLNSTRVFYYYNSDDYDWGSGNHGDIYDNVFDGPMARGDNTYSTDPQNLPDLWDYNLYYYASDQNCESLWNCNDAYYDNSVISLNSVTYDSGTMTATVADNFAGIGQGRFGGDIGGFSWGSPPPPANRNYGGVSGSFAGQ